MTTMTQQQGEEDTAARIRRSASGVAIDPARLAWFREARGWSRQDLAAAVNALGWTEDDGSPLTITRDAIGKNEKPRDHPDARSPRPLTLQAYCEALSQGLPESKRIIPEHMKPGRPLVPQESALERDFRRRHNAAMRRFAEARGIPYRNPDTRRVYYTRGLQEAYTLYASGADDAVVAAAVKAARGEDGFRDRLLAS